MSEAATVLGEFDRDDILARRPPLLGWDTRVEVTRALESHDSQRHNA